MGVLEVTDVAVDLARVEERLASMGAKVADLDSGMKGARVQLSDLKDDMGELKTQVALALHNRNEIWEAIKANATGLRDMQDALVEHQKLDMSEVLKRLRQKGSRDRWIVRTVIAALGLGVAALGVALHFI